jgi:hypothetical protein
LTEGNAYILYGMVSVNVEVAFSNNFQIDHAVTSNLIQHVLQEGHTGIEFSLPRTIEAELYTDAGLQSCSLDTSAARRRYRSHDLCSWEINAFWADAPKARYNGDIVSEKRSPYM